MTTHGADHLDRESDRPAVEIRRSARRRRTVSAYREGAGFVVLVPARMSRKDAQAYADELVARIEKRERRATPGDDELRTRAVALIARWMPEAPAPVSVRWVTNQHSRWASCTPADGTIRMSHRLRGMPAYVLDYVLLHEIAHLLVPGHGPDFERLLAPYPRLLEARAFLDGASFARGAVPDTEPDTEPDMEPQAAIEESPSSDRCEKDLPPGVLF